MNISEKTIIKGIEKTGCKRNHLAHCLNAHGMSEVKKYNYFGIHTQRGIVELRTKVGTFEAVFSCKNGWVQELVFLERRHTNDRALHRAPVGGRG